MNVERATRLAVAFAGAVAGARPARLCAVCTEFVKVTAAGITIMGGDNAGPICVSSPQVRALEDLQFTIVLSLQDAAAVGTLGAGLDDAVAYRAETYQASGMIAIQLQIPASEALLRIRAHAFANDRPLSAVAADIVARRLRLDNDRSQPDEMG